MSIYMYVDAIGRLFAVPGVGKGLVLLMQSMLCPSSEGLGSQGAINRTLESTGQQAQLTNVLTRVFQKTTFERESVFQM